MTEMILMDAIGLTRANSDNSDRTRTAPNPKESKRSETHKHQQVSRPAKNRDKGSGDVIDEMLNIIKKRELEIEQLKEKNERAEQRIRDTERRSNAVTSEMAKMMDMKGSFENVNDEFANSKIAETFYKLYDDDWVHMLRWFGTNFKAKSELEIIHHLAELMRFGYEDCLRLATSQIRQIFLLNDPDPDPDQKQYEELFALRRQYAQKEAVRTRMKQAVWEKLMKMEDMTVLMFGENGKQATERLQTFFNKYNDCCWLMIVSNPPMVLNFNVIGTPHEDCSEHFRPYSLKKPVTDSTKEGTIYEVVWPSVCLPDGSACYKKGDVVIVNEGKKPMSEIDNHTTEAQSSQSGGASYPLTETSTSGTGTSDRKEKDKRHSVV
ncbi:uncharacterized protein LOC128547988 isoform X2 [Mercenaria mercenaria]|uniref:uncharacterized protein LOC128547988 isoform X2 n=1 Tax=Mercenaria mercenaria TaxID=6596 RepID=UPI00234EC55E|nr:uncharacterized protein LOC128547988 isoform X2 [Mercenaria mercenaria]